MQLLKWAKDQFAANGLPEPLFFRAGGWYADIDTLQALADSGFLIDSSGRPYYELGENKIPGPWNLKDTTKPYKPSVLDQNKTGSNTINIWEFPNNGEDSWRLDGQKLIAKFDANYNGVALDEAGVLNYVSHPHAIGVDIPRLKVAYNHIEQYTISTDSGPVVYISIMDLLQEIAEYDS
jgi:hypothetical protein